MTWTPLDRRWLDWRSPAQTSGAEVDSDDAEQRSDFAARLTSALLELTQDTLQVSTDPGALATIAHRWLEIAERLEKVAGPGAGGLGLATAAVYAAWLASMT